MNLILAIAEFYVPGPIKRRKFLEIFALTAEAFGVEPPVLTGLSYGNLLKVYARFSAEAAGRLLKSKDGGEEARRRLACLAYAYGQELRRQFHVKNRREAMRMGKLIYRLSGIQMTAAPEGEILISRCFFKDHYSPGICYLMSGLDEGIFTSLSGDRNFKFLERLTEGHACCRARLD
jgi:hypothetical protein